MRVKLVIINNNDGRIVSNPINSSNCSDRLNGLPSPDSDASAPPKVGAGAGVIGAATCAHRGDATHNVAKAETNNNGNTRRLVMKITQRLFG
jgi:hypothetical protein